MDQNHEVAVTQMRMSVEKLGSSTEKYEDPTLMRFLIARSMDTDKAAKMFVQWLQWRASFVSLNYIPDSEVQDELNSRKIYLQGQSTKGCPVLLVKIKNHLPAKDQLQFKKFVVHLLDKAISSSFRGREIGNEKLIAILDLHQIAYKNIDTRGLITGFQFLQIVIVCNEEERRELIRTVGEEALPEGYGGRAKLVALQDFVITPSDDKMP
ncbi:Sec14p-like phosphatidylinositol transfer family protein [Abeliophyllum distichum]|uniref:Sec14p-like phosphatidylinositol transfer family protein n=1 Tax=Abeliophyllum distichum TaxID=126358 RepID=A0ABD1U261_9LAMI